jgi:hypothetical protein
MVWRADAWLVSDSYFKSMTLDLSKSGRGQPHFKALRAAVTSAGGKNVLVARAGDLERLGKEFFPHLAAHCRRELIETLFGLRGYVLVIEP